MVNGIDGAELFRRGMIPKDLINIGQNQAFSSLYQQLGPHAEVGIGKAIIDYSRTMGTGGETNADAKAMASAMERAIIRPMNERAKAVRDVEGWLRDESVLTKSELQGEPLKKAVLDVGSLTNFSSVVGGQSLGYVSLDTRMARGTVRPNSFTLYQCLDKSLAWQVVDFWATATATGGASPGAAFSTFTSMQSGSLATSAGAYQLNNIILKLALDGRAITTALAAQNSYVNVSEQENINAALTVLKTLNYASYWGDSTMYPNQFDGVYHTLINNSLTGNIFDFQLWNKTFGTANSWSNELSLYNQIYDVAAQITSFGTFGRITHAFMSPMAMGTLQGLTTTQLNNVISQITQLQDRAPILINGNLVGMQTRTGHIQFPLDMFIDVRQIPEQANPEGNATNPATATNPAPPVTVVPGLPAPTANSEFAGAFTPTNTGIYSYAVASTNDSMVESQLTYCSGWATPVAAGDGVPITIGRPADLSATGYRVYRSSLLPSASTVVSGTPSNYRFIGAIRDSGAATTVFTDLNGGGTTFVPGSTSIFLLDMDPVDFAIDYRVLLPLVRVELFAGNLFMPWAVATIGALRMRVPKFHGVIKNYLPTNPVWSPLYLAV